MSRALRQKLRRLKAEAAPVIAAREQYERGGDENLRVVAKRHLLRVIAVYRYGDPKIDEPLESAYERAMLKLGCDIRVEMKNDVVQTVMLQIAIIEGRDTSDLQNLSENQALVLFENTLRKEHSDGDINLQLAVLIKEVPDWLLFFTKAGASGDLLGIDVPDAPASLFGLAPESADDFDLWPDLPKGILKRYSDADTRAFYRNDEEMAACTAIMLKPKARRTRNEIRFVQDLCRRNGIDPRQLLNRNY
jgi:hypothetical protein